MEIYPHITVLMASHNRGAYIEFAIQSVIEQTYENWDLIICDDNSTDNSWKVIQNYAINSDRIKAIKNQINRGVGFTKKKLLDTAKGDVFCILDADDALTEDALEIVSIAHAINPNVALIYSDHYMCDKELKVTKKKSISRQIPNGENHLTYHGIGHMVTVKKAFYEKIIPLESSLKIAVDQDFYYKMEEVGSVLYLDQKLYFYRNNEQSISLNKNKYLAAQCKIAIMREARQRRIQQHLPLKIPSLERLELFDWWAKNEFGRGNIIKSVLKATNNRQYHIVKEIFRYHIHHFRLRYLS